MGGAALLSVLSVGFHGGQQVKSLGRPQLSRTPAIVSRISFATLGAKRIFPDLDALANSQLGPESLPDADAVTNVVDAVVAARLWPVGVALPILVALCSTRASASLLDIFRYTRGRPRGGEDVENDATSARQIYDSSPLARNSGAVMGDCLVYMCRLAYHLRIRATFATWSELPLLLVQSVGLVLLNNGRPTTRAAAQKRAFANISLLSLAALLLMRLPSRMLPLLCLWTVPLSVISYVHQSVRLFKHGSANSLSYGAVWLRWLASLVRVITTTAYLASDPYVLANHVVGLLGCSALLWQIIYYNGPGPSRKATRRAIYARLLSGPDASPPPSDEYRSGLLLWLSLGGFGDSPPSYLSNEVLRKAFDAIDADRNGLITRDELMRAIAEGTGVDGRTRGTAVLAEEGDRAQETLSEMIALADADGNGEISFTEYKAMIVAHAPLIRPRFDGPVRA